MDFHSLSRKDLQTLCKKNKIPANMTNVDMADELTALPHVEGLEELLNQTESDCQLGTQSVPRTATRTSTRQKPVKEAPGSSVVPRTRSRRMTRAVIADEIEQEYMDDSSIRTPTTRRRTPAVSNQKRVETKNEDDVGKDNINVFETSAVQSSRRRGTVRTLSKKMETPTARNSLQKTYSTRRSVRLLEKSIATLSLEHTEQKGCTKSASTFQDRIDASENSHEIEEVEKDPSFETERSDEIEAISVEKKISDGIESSDFESKLDLGEYEGSEVLRSSDNSDIPENVKEVNVSNDTEGSDINCSLPDISSHLSLEQVDEKHSSSDDSAEAIKGVSAGVIRKEDTEGGGSLVLSASDESICKSVAVDPNADILYKADKYESLDVEERSFGDFSNLKAYFQEFVAEGNSDDAGSLVLSACDESISKSVVVDPNADILDKADKFEGLDVEEKKAYFQEFVAEGNSDDAGSLVLSACDESISKSVVVDPNADILDKADKFEGLDVEEKKAYFEEFAAEGNSDDADYSKLNSFEVEIEAPGGQRDVDENKSCPLICTKSVANPETIPMPLKDPISCPVKPEKVEPEMTELSEKADEDTENIVSDNELSRQFPRPTLTSNKSVEEKEIEIFDEKEDGEAESKKDTVKLNIICDGLDKLSLRTLKKMFRESKIMEKSKGETQNGDLMQKKVEEKRTALQLVEPNRIPDGEVQNKNQDV